ncbi:MAG: LysR family transcriptional regulator [Pseudomonadota bacterium]
MNQIFTPPAPAASLDIDVLRSVVEIAETGSMTVAAERVGRTPAALSMQLKKLEETLGRALFTRNRQGMSPTSEGHKLLVYARKMVDLNRAALDAFRGPALSGEITIGTTDDLGYQQLANVLAGFAQSHCGVTVNVVMGQSTALATSFDKGTLDMTLLSPGCAVGRRDSDITLHRETLVWMGAEGGCAKSRTPLPVAVANSGCAWRRQVIEALTRSGREYRVAYVSDFDAALQAAISADLAVAALPESRLGPGLVPLSGAAGLPDPGESEIVLRVGQNPSPAVMALSEHIAESYHRLR